jgi:hypothetical protein
VFVVISAVGALRAVVAGGNLLRGKLDFAIIITTAIYCMATIAFVAAGRSALPKIGASGLFVPEAHASFP